MPLIRVIAVLALLIACVSCSSAGSDPNSLAARAGDGKLTIGIRFDQPGLSERTIDGRFTGFDVDVARYVARELGVDAEDITWRETTSAARETDLTSGVADLVVAAYSITDKRKQLVSFA